jgi:hypothetical protein
VIVSMGSDLLNLRGADHRAEDSSVSSAAAEIAGESLSYLFQSRMRRLAENGARGHDHTVCTIAALSGLLGDESRLDGTRFFRCSQTFERRNASALDLFDG